jgi:hypothetical protein
MRRTLLAAFALAFMAYWFWTGEYSVERQASLMPVLPSSVRRLPEGAARSPTAASSAKGVAADGAVRRWLEQESARVGRVDPSPEASVVRLKKKALSLKPTELEFLGAAAADPGVSADERFLAVYIIGLSEAAAAKDVLRAVSQLPIPPTSNDRAYSDEVVIRAHAMEALVQRLSQQESLLYLNDVLKRATDASIVRHARYLLSKL